MHLREKHHKLLHIRLRYHLMDYAARINSLTSSGTSKINFYIGYDESLTADMENFSLCSVQPSAEMTALLLSEQTYRAYTILNNITYHK